MWGAVLIDTKNNNVVDENLSVGLKQKGLCVSDAPGS